MRYLILLLVAFPLLFAQTNYLWEGFNDGNADGWVEFPDDSLASYEVTANQMYHMFYTGSAETWALAYWNSLMPSADYTMLVDFTAHGVTTHMGLCGRFDVQVGSGYVAYAHYGLDRLVVGKYTPGWTTLGTQNFNFVYDQYYQMKFRISSDSLFAKVWELNGTEPGWQIIVTDSELAGPGYVVLECGHHPSGSFSGEFDNVLVADSIPDAMNQTTWAGIKSSFWLR